MAVRVRFMTEKVDYTQDAEGRFALPETPDVFSQKIITAVNKGFAVSGTPSLSFNEATGALKAVQRVVMHRDDSPYEGFQTSADLPDLLPHVLRHATEYRLLVGDESREFCEFVEGLMNPAGRWSMIGDPVSVYDPVRRSVAVAQAIYRSGGLDGIWRPVKHCL